ncbi:MAG: M23 family metallopeptidase [Nitrospirae bacterium]|nr:M23 family metallopeptidase [Nitrospirota bacterium]
MNEFAVKKSRFTELLMRNNAAEERGFKEWIFNPGMLFKAGKKWWGDGGKRSNAHEGLDLCLYRNRQGMIVRLEAGMAVPAMYDGTVVKIIDDFIGKSVIIDHSFTSQRRFCSVYGHTVPEQGMKAGSRVSEGDVIAALSDPGQSKKGLFPHLHITLGLLSGEASYEFMDWETLGKADVLLLDPLEVIGGNYVIEDLPAVMKP